MGKSMPIILFGGYDEIDDNGNNSEMIKWPMPFDNAIIIAVYQ